MTRQQTLDKAIEYVTEDRRATHGKPEDTFASIAALWSSYIGQKISDSDVCRMMALLKISRSKMNPKHEDNYIDIAGYAACAAELSEK